MNSSRLRSQRSTDAPMDYEYTSRPNTKPVWASADDPTTPKKRSHADLHNPPTPLHNPTFGQNQNMPFIFQTPPPQSSPAPYPWGPPPNFSAAKAFPPAPELPDIDMREASPPKRDASPPKPETTAAASSPPESGRKFATGGMRRILKSRMKSALSVSTVPEHDADSDSEDEERQQLSPATASSNHYTLNLPSPAAPQADLPYILLGYLQFFFNLSLILLFLYLVVQFILTVQRDVTDRISEYSMDIVQDIAMCALQHRNNLCDSPLPAMAQQCAIWATCMSRDPSVVGRAKVSAEMIAEVVNGFVEPISWKTLGFTLTSLSFLTVFINAMLSLYLRRSRPEAPPAPPPQPFPMHNFGGYLSPAPTPSWGRAGAARSWTAEEPETPSRRRRRLEGGKFNLK